MLDAIEKLLILQDNDRKFFRAQSELKNLSLQRQRSRQQLTEAQQTLDKAREKVKQLETKRHDKELETDSNKQLMQKYTQQQFQTKKNEEYQALTHEIDRCKKKISELEDEQLGLMEQIEAAENEVEQAKREYERIKQQVEQETNELDEKESHFKKELEELQSKREELKQPVESSLLRQYERILGHRGSTVVVSIDRGVCGGCHMTLPPQVIVSCKGEQEIVKCPNCSRILYYTRDMEV